LQAYSEQIKIHILTRIKHVYNSRKYLQYLEWKENKIINNFVRRETSCPYRESMKPQVLTLFLYFLVTMFHKILSTT
jgi:hypothetical protein